MPYRDQATLTSDLKLIQPFPHPNPSEYTTARRTRLHPIPSAIPSLSSDILLEILQYLRNPILPAHTACGQRAPIEQSDLFACLQVSKDWYNIAAPILYKYVVAGNFPHFLYRHKPRYSSTGELEYRTIPGLISKTELFGLIQRLFIEYNHKFHAENHEEDDTVARVTDGLIDMGEENAKNLFGGDEGMSMMIQLVSEAKELSQALRVITGYPRCCRANVFSRLRTLSVGAIFGQQEEQVQLRYNPTAKWDEYSQMVREMQRSFRQLVSSVPTLQHYCQSPSLGPLSLGCQSPSLGPLSLGETTYLPGSNDSRPTVAFHTYSRYDISKRAAIGVESRWYAHQSQWLGYRKLDFHQIAEAKFLCLLASRDALAVNHGRAKSGCSIKMAIYHCLPPWVNIAPGHPPHAPPVCRDRKHPKLEEDKAAWREESDQLTTKIAAGIANCKERLGEDDAPEDTVTWGQLFDAPPCDACGWQYSYENAVRKDPLDFQC